MTTDLQSTLSEDRPGSTGPAATPVRRKPAWALLAIAVLQATVALSLADEAPQYVRIDGRIDLSSTSKTGKTTTNSYPFHCVIGEDRWAITEHWMANAINRYHFDGFFVYRVTEMTRNPDLKLPTAAVPAFNPFTQNPNQMERYNARKPLVITPGAHPLGNVGVNIPWLAYGSSRYLTIKGRLIPLPICNIKHTRNAFSYRDETVLLSGAPGLPGSIRWFESNALFEQAALDPRLSDSAKFSGWSHPTTDPGKLACEYEVLATTNRFGRTLPLEFRINSTAYYPGGKSARRSSARGTTISVKPSPPPIGPHKSGGPYQIIDLRAQRRMKINLSETTQQLWNESIGSTNAAPTPDLPKQNEPTDPASGTLPRP